MLVFAFYCALVTFIVYCIYAKVNNLPNRHALFFTTISIELIFIMECIAGKFSIILYLVFTDELFFIIVFCYFSFFLWRIFLAYIISADKKTSTMWWERFIATSLDLTDAARLHYISSKTKRFKKEYNQYWEKKLFDKKLQFRHNLYIKLVSYSYIILYIICIFIFIFLNFFIWFIDGFAIFVTIRVFICDNFFYLGFIIFIYRLFLSYIFPNINFRHFLRFHSVTRIHNGEVVDSYLISNTYVFYKILAGKRHMIDRDIISYSCRVLGMKRFMRRYYGKDGPKYFINFKKKCVFIRYYMPVNWISCRNYTAGALVDTPYYRFRHCIYKYKHLIFTGSLKAYLLNRKDEVDDSCSVELSKYYEKDLKMNFKY